MAVQYVHDEKGRATAVIVPIHEWEALRVKNLEYADDVTDEELAEAEAAWAGHESDPSGARPVEDVARELLDERDD